MFLRKLPEGPSYAVEVRHRSWLGPKLPDLLRKRGAALTLVDYPGMPRLEEATANFVYIRWLGDRREFPLATLARKKIGSKTCAGGQGRWIASSRRARRSSLTPTTTTRTMRPQP
jgi:uncharacterized protein YecE (DUF72 family)